MKNSKRILISILCIALIVYLSIFAYRIIIRAIYPVRYSEYIEENSEKYGLDKYLVMGVIKAESNYIYDAHSGVARGLMQITDETAVWISKQLDIEFTHEDIEKPEKNIEMGCFYLNYLISHYKNTDVALAAYNAGMGNVNKWLSSEEYSVDGEKLSYIPYKETREYIKKVNKYQQKYKDLYSEKTR